MVNMIVSRHVLWLCENMMIWKYDDMKIRWYYTAAPSQFVSPQILFVWCFPISTPFCARNLEFLAWCLTIKFFNFDWWKNYPETVSQEEICIRSYDIYLSYVYVQNMGIQQKLNFKVVLVFSVVVDLAAKNYQDHWNLSNAHWWRGQHMASSFWHKI